MDFTINGMIAYVLVMGCLVTWSAGIQQDRLIALRQRMKNFERTQDQLEQRVSRVDDTYSPGGAFTVRLSGNTVYSEGETIIFDDVYYDDSEGAYNRETGVYTCTLNGTYLFTYTMDTRSVVSFGGTVLHNSSAGSEILARLQASTGSVDGARVNGKGTDNVSFLVTLAARDTLHLEATNQCGAGQCELTVNSRFTGTLIATET